MRMLARSGVYGIHDSNPEVDRCVLYDRGVARVGQSVSVSRPAVILN